MGLRDTRGAGKRAARPPSPLLTRRARPASPAPVPVTLKDPQRLGTSGAGDLDVKDAIRAVIEQQRIDHDYLVEAAAAVRALGTALAEEQSKRAAGLEEAGQLHLGLRRELYAVRDTLEGSVQQKVPEMLNTMFEQNGPGFIMVAKLEETQRAVAALQLHVASLTNQEEQVENFLKNLQQELPRDGQALANYVSTEVGQVREMVKKFEPGNVTTCSSQHIPFTQEMSRHIRALEETINQHQQGFNEMVYAFNAIQAEQGVTTQRIAANDLDIKGIREEIATRQTRPAPVRLDLRGAFSGTSGAAPAPSCAQGCGCSDAGPSPGTAGAPGGFAGSGDNGASGSGAWSSWQRPSPPGLPQSGATPPGEGGSLPLQLLQAVVGGNGECHCVHVEELRTKVAAIEARLANASRPPPGPASVPSSDPYPDFWAATDGHARAAPGQALPLDLKGPLGAISFKDRAIFDEKLAIQEDYRFNGTKGGLAWKGKVERHFISRAPVLKEILEWAEACELQEIDPGTFRKAVLKKLDEEQAVVLNAALWGFLSVAVSHTAETIFKGAGTLNGIDAWRRLARFIDQGKALRLETLRREVKVLHTKPISSLERVEEGVAEWENVYQEYILAGGTRPKDSEMMADLLAVLPGELRETLLWKTTEEGVTYNQFRNHILTQAGRVLMNRKKLPIHALDEDIDDDGGDYSFDLNQLDEIVTAVQRLQQDGNETELLAAVQRFQRGGGRRFPGRRSGEAGPQSSQQSQRRTDGNPGRISPVGVRSPKKCPNCAKTHEGRCTAAPVSPAERLCWGCGKKGHVSRNCPDRKRDGSSIKAIEDRRLDGIQACFSVTDEDGYTTVAPPRGHAPAASGHAPARRPMPTAQTLGDFMDVNIFAALSPSGHSEPTTWRSPSKTTRSTASPTSTSARSTTARAEQKIQKKEPQAAISGPLSGIAEAQDLGILDAPVPGLKKEENLQNDDTMEKAHIDQLPIDHPDKQWEILKRIQLGPVTGCGVALDSPLTSC